MKMIFLGSSAAGTLVKVISWMTLDVTGKNQKDLDIMIRDFPWNLQKSVYSLQKSVQPIIC